MRWKEEVSRTVNKWRRLARQLDWKTVIAIQFELRPYLQGVPYWTAGFLVGVIAILYSGAFSKCIDLVRWVYDQNPYYLFITSPIFFVLASWIVEKFAPPAGGTGIPTVNAALAYDWNSNPGEIHLRLRLRVAVVVVLSSLLQVLGTGSLGREGPMVHIAACVFYFVGVRLNPIWPYQEHRSWIVAGGAAGVAAAFNAPLAGVIFVLEELAQQHFHRFKTVVISAAIVGGITSQWLSGRYLYLGYPTIGTVGFSSVPWAVLVGILCGIFALPFHYMLTQKFQRIFSTYFNTRTKFAAFIGLSVAALAIFVDKGVIGGGISNIQDLLYDRDRASWSLIVGRLLSTALSHLSGCAGGFLAPSLALGAGIGSKLAELTNYDNHNLMVMIGMAAFLSAIVKAPFTAWVIVMEMTDRHSAIFPLMVASIVSTGTVRFFQERHRKATSSDSQASSTTHSDAPK